MHFRCFAQFYCPRCGSDRFAMAQPLFCAECGWPGNKT